MICLKRPNTLRRIYIYNKRMSVRNCIPVFYIAAELPESGSTSSISSSNSLVSNNFSTFSSKVAKPPPSSTFNYSSIKELVRNRVDSVIITHVNSPSDFYLQLYDNDSIITTITNELSRFVQTTRSDVAFIEKGRYCIFYVIDKK